MWALIGGWSVWVLSRRRPARLPLWVPMTLAFAASGSLFAWSGWKLPMAVIRPGDYVTAEYPVVAVLQHTLSIGGGLVLLAATLSAASPGGPARSASAAVTAGPRRNTAHLE
ncbi:hypothetical protein [Actinomadura sp. HBU206391]|uniref:hypothetical protein n=1 Tax=Actinomadura sp. HBU206391 TaxID=2731692 RepID=UPI0016504820|nr:hypothetical protein [Actinomadura sp. HBU206391]MBC6462755.1 hypothetical protein [Actinomadura sp. HBU206391]